MDEHQQKEKARRNAAELIAEETAEQLDRESKNRT